MTGLTVSRTQRAGAQGLLNEAMAVANGWPSWKRTCYRQWLKTPSESRRVVLGQAGFSEAQWAARLAPLLPTWRAQERAAASA